MGFLKAFKKKKDKGKAAVDGGNKAAKETQKPQSPPAAKTTTNAVAVESARPAGGGGGSDAPTIGSSAHNSAENLGYRLGWSRYIAEALGARAEAALKEHHCEPNP